VVHNPTNTVISFGLLIAVVGSSFAYVYSTIEPTPYLGVNGGIELTPARAQALGIDQTEGILVTEVDPGSPADRAGLKGGDRVVMINNQQVPVGGDVIIAFDGEPVTREREYLAVLDQKSVGDTLVMTVMRGGSTHEISVVLGEERQ
jgi:serine protease Do